MLCPAAQELLPPLWRTEMPLVRVIVDMEAAGLAVNEDILNTGKRSRFCKCLFHAAFRKCYLRTVLVIEAAGLAVKEDILNTGRAALARSVSA